MEQASMTAAKTGAERVANHHARLREQGLKQVRSLWAHPDDVQAIREYAAKLARKRERLAKCAP